MAGNKRRRTNGGFLTTGNKPLNVLSPSSTSQPSFLSTFDRESHYPIFSAFCDCLSIAEIISLTRTCKRFSGLYQYLLPVQWDVDKALRRYVDDPQGFRTQMARCDALINGDFACEYFERVVWSYDSLDLYIQPGLGPELFSKYLLHTAGYSEVIPRQNYQGSLIVEVRIYAMISVSGIHAEPIASAEPDLHQRYRQQSSDHSVHYRLPTCSMHTSSDRYYCKSQHYRLEQSLLCISAADIHSAQVLYATIL